MGEDEEEEKLTMLKDEDAGAFYRRQIRHRDTLTYKIVAVVFGVFFFGGSIVFFVIDANKFFLPILFYDVVGTVMLVYGLNLSEFESKKQEHNEFVEDLKNKINNKDFEMQVNKK